MIFSFYIGAAVLIVTILWTVFTTKEYSPEELKAFESKEKSTEKNNPKFSDIFKDMATMPKTMKQLSVTQFFTWIALFGMWVFTTPAIAQHVYLLPVTDTSSPTYQDAGNWVGFFWRLQWCCHACACFTSL